MEIVRMIERLARGNLPKPREAVARAEVDLMRLGTLVPIQIDPERALATLRAVIDHVPPDRRYQYGLAGPCTAWPCKQPVRAMRRSSNSPDRRRRRRSASTPARPAGSSASSSSTGRPATSSACNAWRGPRTNGVPASPAAVGQLGTSLPGGRPLRARRPGRRHRAVCDRGARLRILPPHGLARSVLRPGPGLPRGWPHRGAGERCGVAARSCSMRGRWSMFPSSRPTRPTWPSSPATCHERRVGAR